MPRRKPPTAALPRLLVFDDGHGEDCDPPEPGKRWLTLGDQDGEEIAVLVRRKGEPTPEQYAHAAEIAKRCNTHAALLDALKTAEAHLAEMARDHKTGQDALVLRAVRDALAEARVE